MKTILISIIITIGLTLNLYSQCGDCSRCIVINEFTVDPKDGENGNSSSTGEFIEIYNKCTDAVDIGCYVLCLTDDTGGGRGDCITIPSGVTLNGGETYLFGGYGTNCTGGETDCDWDGMTLDFNWHSNATEVWDVTNDEFFTTNSGKYIGVLLDGGEEITLFDNCGTNIDGVTYSNGSGSYTTTENIDAVNGCDAKSITIDTDDVINLGSTPGGSTADEGWQRQCDETWSFTQMSDQTPGVDEDCTEGPCSTALLDDGILIVAEYLREVVKLSGYVIANERYSIERLEDEEAYTWKDIVELKEGRFEYQDKEFKRNRINYYRIGTHFVAVDTRQNKEIEKIIDYTGREISIEYATGIIFILYKDGSKQIKHIKN